MIAAEQNQALLVIGTAAAGTPAWAAYAAYCLAREKGMRNIALQHLAVFVA